MTLNGVIADILQLKYNFRRKTLVFRFGASFEEGARGKVYDVHWKARSGLPININ